MDDTQFDSTIDLAHQCATAEGNCKNLKKRLKIGVGQVKETCTKEQGQTKFLDVTKTFLKRAGVAASETTQVIKKYPANVRKEMEMADYKKKISKMMKSMDNASESAGRFYVSYKIAKSKGWDSNDDADSVRASYKYCQELIETGNKLKIAFKGLK
jgi:hypothetical protein